MKILRETIILLIYITMSCGADNIMQNIPHIQDECEEYFAKYRQSTKNVMYLNNVMAHLIWSPIFKCRMLNFGSKSGH